MSGGAPEDGRYGWQYAGRAQRHTPTGGRDDFPTPAWAGRALCGSVLPAAGIPTPLGRVLEPACGRGSLIHGLRDYCAEIEGADAHDYGYKYPVRCFLNDPVPAANWIITNPPFSQWLEFARRAVEAAGTGVALLGRLAALESARRLESLWRPMPPAVVAVFSSRLAIAGGRLDPRGTTATAYAWFIWHRESRPGDGVRLEWIDADARARYDRPGDWDIGRRP